MNMNYYQCIVIIVYCLKVQKKKIIFKPEYYFRSNCTGPKKYSGNFLAYPVISVIYL